MPAWPWAIRCMRAGSSWPAGAEELGNDAVLAAMGGATNGILTETLSPFGYEAARYDFKKDRGRTQAVEFRQEGL